MEAYKFETTVLENGMIKIPQINKYANQKVEVFVVLKSTNIVKSEQKSIDEFLNKWSGFFSEVDTDDDKYNYLMEKYK